jgi:uncharacterized protein (DUF4415 family)
VSQKLPYPLAILPIFDKTSDLCQNATSIHPILDNRRKSKRFQRFISLCDRVSCTQKQPVSFHQEKYSPMKGSFMSNTSRTDWSRIDAMTDDDIDTSDIPRLTDEFFSKAKLRMPSSPITTVSVPLDSETLTWFQSKGEAAEQHMTAVLRIYAAVQKTAAMHQSA